MQIPQTTANLANKLQRSRLHRHLAAGHVCHFKMSAFQNVINTGQHLLPLLNHISYSTLVGQKGLLKGSVGQYHCIWLWIKHITNVALHACYFCGELGRRRNTPKGVSANAEVRMLDAQKKIANGKKRMVAPMACLPS